MSPTTPLTRLPGAHVRRTSPRARLVRIGVVTVVLVALAAGAAAIVSRSSGSSPPLPATTTSAPTGSAAASAPSTLLPWALAAPLSRAVVLTGPGSQLVIMGGLTTSGISAEGVYTLETATGHLTHIANLTSGLHDAAGAVIAGSDVVFGGGSPTTVAGVQAVTAPTAAPSSGTVARATVLGTLPQPRSDAASATIGTTTYIVGGYDGTNADPAVLSTTDGRSFVPTAALALPVRYPAVAAWGGTVYVFGGQAVTGAGAGQPVRAIQAVDLRHHTAKVVGRLPTAVEAAIAFTVGARVFVAGGDDGPAPPAPGATTTASTAGTGEAAAGSAATSTIWAYDPARHTVSAVGHLAVAVSHSAVALIGSTAWLVGGESSGVPVGAVQTITPGP